MIRQGRLSFQPLTCISKKNHKEGRIYETSIHSHVQKTSVNQSQLEIAIWLYVQVIHF